MKKKQITIKGFTLIELLIVMSIVALLLTMVGPLAINSVEKAEAKQEMLSIKNWFRKVSAKAFMTGETHYVKLSGKQVTLYIENQQDAPLETISLNSVFFHPQLLTYNRKGFVSPNVVEGTYRQLPLKLELSEWINNEQPLTP